jgi:hypothetical protein
VPQNNFKFVYLQLLNIPHYLDGKSTLSLQVSKDSNITLTTDVAFTQMENLNKVNRNTWLNIFQAMVTSP